MKTQFKKCCALLLCLLLAGCETAPSSGEPEYLDSSAAAGGYYALLTYRDGTGSLIRYDYETMQCAYLSGETDPRDENSPAFLPSVVGDAWLLANSRHLYVLKRPVPAELLDDGHKTQGPGWLMRMEPDGTGRKTLPLPENAGLVYEASAVLEGEKLLLVLCQADGDGTEKWYLAEADFDAGAIRLRLEFEKGATAHLCGTCARGPILSLREAGKSQQFCLYDLEKNILEPIPFGQENAPWCLDGGSGAVYYPEGEKIWCYDVATGQSKATAARLPDGWAQARFEEVTDGHLFLVRGKPGEEGYDRIALCLATGEVFRPDLKENGERVTIAAITPKEYLVRLGGITLPYQSQAPGGTPVENEVRLGHYAMMDKADYWNNRPIWREFNNLAYELYSPM